MLQIIGGFRLHSSVSWAAGAFGDRPSDIVKGALSLAGFAVQAVGRIGRLYFVVYRLVYARRAEGDTGAVEPRCAFSAANVGIQNR